jgi:predicted RNA-binding Zn ribbon-like protein
VAVLSPTPLPPGSRVSIDLTWTLRFREVWPTDLLVTAPELRSWMHERGFPLGTRVTADELVECKELREAVYRAATRVIDGRSIAATDRRIINRWAREVPPVPLLRSDGSMTLEVRGNGLHSALGTIARDAIEVLTAGDGRLRRCEGPMCSLLFYDESRPGSRRWCSTARCGNRVNTRLYRQRHGPDSMWG